MDQSASSRYTELESDRSQFLIRARSCAAYTIPALMPQQGTHNNQLTEPYSGFGARVVDNLSNKLLLALYPPGQVPFQLAMSHKALLESGGDLTVPPAIQKDLTLMEQSMNAEIENRVWRKPTFLSLLYLVVTGNSCEQMMEDNTIRIFRLDQYVVVRDTQGNILELIVKELISHASLDEDHRAMVGPDDATNGKHAVYTKCTRNRDGTYEIQQEINDLIVPDSKQTRKTLPFNVLRWTEVIGESYGRSKCDQHLPDLRSIDSLTKAVLDGAAMASRNVNMIRPNAAGGLNLRRRLATAENGDYITGNPEDVAMLSFQNLPSLQYIASQLEGFKQEISASFLMNSSVQRDAEQVTALEIRKLTEELEGTLGGVYTLLSVEMQAPRINRLLIQMQDQGKLPEVEDGLLEPVILTGLQALGREQDLDRVARAAQAAQMFPQEELYRIKWGDLMTRTFNALSLPNSVMTEDEAQEVKQQQQQQAMQANAMNAGAQAAATTAGQGLGAAATQQEQ